MLQNILTNDFEFCIDIRIGISQHTNSQLPQFKISFLIRLLVFSQLMLSPVYFDYNICLRNIEINDVISYVFCL